MRHLFKIYLLFIVSISISAQESEEAKVVLGNYIFTSSFQTNEETNFYGKPINNQTTIHEAGSIVNVLENKGDSVIVQYYRKRKISNPNETQKNEANTFNMIYYKDANTLKYYKIKKEDFIKVASPYYAWYKGATAGIYSVPFKLRFNNFDFEQNLNIGMSIGVQYRINKKIDDRWIIEPNVGIGLAKINLNSKNSSVDNERTASAFSISTGLILRFNTAINAGVFVGWDLLSNSDSDANWIHDKKPWLGLGINIGFNISEGKKSKEKN
ncbi:hypothetical protein P8625_05665 [Tenacibaculum tangerinum]|uniref:DUF3575 domain-containing protein n=1 Tax=Tenacibaculum tangerinum TaxID=3038772 RepID=A0ABY8L5F2_9FLAO|nr:hypothetical protein [Tenacibaculum tangerinum]WGH76646.1 hypothetical protein P8625_05665 [Tenacibaculum tangerinum]